MGKKLNNIVFFASNDGGHFSQLMALKDLFGKYKTVIVSDNERADRSMPALKDVYAIEKAMSFADRRKELTDDTETLTRWNYAFAYLKLFRQAYKIWKKYRPKVIVSTGSNMAVFFCLIARIRGSKFVYIETRARVYDKSVSGKLVGKFANKVIVQWPEMVDVYGGKADYYGTLI